MQQSNKASLPVTIREIALSDGQIAGHLTLNKPDALNALDLEMAELLLGALSNWQDRQDVLFVVLDGQGDKAFCAGGDIVSMYKAMQQTPQGVPDFMRTFFALEYRLDHTIHTYTKPVVVWGSGIVMGGGMGLMAGASHRVVTDSSRLAMPEISIGLYPDVGGSYFLPRMPGNNGLFLGLTGANINATDACFIGLADYYCQKDSLSAMLDKLQSQTLTPATINTALDEVLNQYTVDDSERVSGQLTQHQALIDSACSGETLPDVVDNIAALESADNKWLQKAQQGLAAGSPITANIVYQQIQRGGDMSLEDCFRMELGLSCRCGEYGEFKEGVRALLIDKDRNPDWHFKSVDSVPQDVVTHFFTSLWDEDEHPLADLESSDE